MNMSGIITVNTTANIVNHVRPFGVCDSLKVRDK
jgi:hypothetical protein